MAWDDAPPTAAELAPPTWDTTPPTPEELPSTAPKSLGGFAKNAVSDVGDIGMGLANTAKEGLYDVPKALFKLPADLAEGKGPSQTELGQFTASHTTPAVAQQMVQPIIHPLEYGYQHPVSQALNVAGALTAGGEMADVAGQYAKRGGQNAGIRALGGMRGQVGQLGAEESRDLAQTMIDKGIIGPGIGEIGMEEKIKNYLDKAGNTIGKYRNMPGNVPSQQDIETALKTQLILKYASGVHAGEQGGLEKAIAEVGKGPLNNFQDLANKATSLNQYATKNKLVQPTTAATDVANQLTSINESAMQKALTPSQWQEYQKALPAYGEGKHAQAFAERGAQREATRQGGTVGTRILDTLMPKHTVNSAMATGLSTAGDALQGIGKLSKIGALTPALAEYLTKKYGQQP
jgi:hypothetical protein